MYKKEKVANATQSSNKNQMKLLIYKPFVSVFVCCYYCFTQFYAILFICFTSFYFSFAFVIYI